MSYINQLVLVLDFGGQYKELIARTVRNLKVYSEICAGSITAEEVRARAPIGIILTGGPKSVYTSGSPLCDAGIFELGIPVLGICYGMQLMCHILGGRVSAAKCGEYGRVAAELESNSALFGGIKKNRDLVLMSHTDEVNVLPDGFHSIAATGGCRFAAIENIEKKLYGVQFHPESGHTRQGKAVIRNFLYKICGASGDYKLNNYLERQVVKIRQRVGKERVLLALSGGVDSSVCARLLSAALPGQLTCIFVDHGLMRQNEGDDIERIFSNEDMSFIRVNAADRFLKKLKGVTDPESKRKIIGNEFIRVFEEQAKKLGKIKFLAQGTIYPDMIESGGELGATIKSHHNVGGLPEKLMFEDIIEPLSGLFKDEVRMLGKRLDLPESLVNRQPFPGPGLAVRVMGEVTEDKLSVLRQADHILCEELSVLKRRPQQYFAVFTGAKSVGVKGDSRTYDSVIALRAVTTGDFMTCSYTPLPHKLLERISSRVTGEIKSVSRVVYDITSKPPATVEWE